MLAGRRRTPWLLIAVGIVANVAGDTANLFDSSLGHTGFVLDAMAWPTSILLLSMAVWVRQRPSDPFAEPKPATFVIPGSAPLAALSVLFVGNLHQTSRIAFLLATATLLLVGVRLVVSVRGMRALSQERRHQSLTDELTGLGNRRSLSLVLDAFFAEFDRSTAPQRRARSRSCSSTSTTSRRSTTPSAIPPATSCCARSARGCRDCLRDTDLLVRLGGDEFVVLLLDADADYATTVAAAVERRAQPAVRARRHPGRRQREHRHRARAG